MFNELQSHWQYKSILIRLAVVNCLPNRPMQNSEKNLNLELRRRTFIEDQPLMMKAGDRRLLENLR